MKIKQLRVQSIALLFMMLFLALFFIAGVQVERKISNLPEGWVTKAKVVRVIDGDTIEVEVKRKLRIRLLDCWSPETRTRNIPEKIKGLAAKQFMEDLADEKEVKVFIPGNYDIGRLFTFSRILAQVILIQNTEENKNLTLSEIMVEAGHAFKTKEELQESLEE